MAATHVKSVKAHSASSVPVTTGGTDTFTVGNLLVAIIAISGADDGTVTVTDTTNTRSFTKFFSKQVNGTVNASVGIFYLANATGGTTTIQMSGLTAGQGGTIIIQEWGGLLTSSVNDVSISNNSTTNTTAHDTGTTATTTQASDLAIAVDTRDGSTVVSLPTAMSNSYALIQDDTTNDYELDGVNYWYLVAGRKDLSSTGTQQTTFTWDSTKYAAGIATFKLAAATAGMTRPIRISTPQFPIHQLNI